MEAFMVVVRAWIILAKSAVDGSAIGKEVEAAEAVGEVGADGVVAAGLECGAEVEENHRLADTKLSRAWAPRVGGPWLLRS
jgi:hypothetical protein